MIDVRCIDVTYKDGTTLHFENIKVNPGHVTIIKGRNGTGKTTLLKAIAGLLPYDGEMTVEGEVTYNSQEPILFNRTVFKNITFPLEVRKSNIEEYHEAIMEYSNVLSITDLLQKNATTLSSGEKMKVSIIRSIIFHPKYVLLDEPTTHLDLESILELKKLIHSLKDKINFIIVSHNKDFIDDIKDKEIKLGG